MMASIASGVGSPEKRPEFTERAVPSLSTYGSSTTSPSTGSTTCRTSRPNRTAKS
jgi:hypothetical protein